MEIRRIGSRAAVAFLLLFIGAPIAAEAQTFERGEVRAYGGAFMPPEASALNQAPYFGMRAGYRLTPMFDVAINVGGTRTTTRADFFRPAVLRFGNRIELWDVRQEITAVQYGAEIGAGFDLGRIAPFLALGGGGYTMFLDAQANQAIERITNMMATGAAGLNIRVGNNSGVSFEVRDYLLMDFNRDALNPVRVDRQDDVFIEHWPTPPEAKDRIHALTLSVGFTYHP